MQCRNVNAMKSPVICVLDENIFVWNVSWRWAAASLLDTMPSQWSEEKDFWIAEQSLELRMTLDSRAELRMTLVSDGQRTMWEQLLNITPRHQPLFIGMSTQLYTIKEESYIQQPFYTRIVSSAVIIFSLRKYFRESIRKYFRIKLEFNFPTERHQKCRKIFDWTAARELIFKLRQTVMAGLLSH